MPKLGIAVLYSVAAVACAHDPDVDQVQQCQDDGFFCNGIERSSCMLAPANPCDDGSACTLDSCDEASGLCAHQPMGNCATCARGDCMPDCSKKHCGSDGCGGSCGGCRAGLGCTPQGTCVSATILGTCARPRTLAVQLGANKRQVIHGDTSHSINQLVPTCNSTSDAVEDVYSFTLTAPTGIEVTSHDYDTVLSLRKDGPAAPRAGCLDNGPAATVACNDDAAPPGDYGSRIATLLAPGTYYLVVDGYDDSDYGPYTLTVRFVAGCVPNCDGQFCQGSDGCGGTCGTCEDGMQCGQDLRCRPFPCKGRCQNDDGSPRVCGDDGCLGLCGRCSAGALCVPETGTCATFPGCDHGSPQCSPACAADSFCGTDCACHGASEPLPDLVPNARLLADELVLDTINVSEHSCAFVEQCVRGLGRRRLLRFSVEAINQGQGALQVAAPSRRPDLFHFSACHGHYHYDGFATYSLLDLQGNEVVHGRKQAFCMEDTRQVSLGPTVACTKRYDCTNQGIQAGWSDVYGNSLDCQWLDITEVPPGDYQVQVILNPNHAFQEVSFDNNTAVVPVHIPAPQAAIE